MSQATPAAAAPAGHTRLYLLHATSPVHIGVGEGVADINLPTARETTTGYPYVPGSSIKGVLRDEARGLGDGEKLRGAFGPPKENAADARGGLVFSDASLLALPVRSVFGTFAYATCPFALKRFVRDASEAGVAMPDKALERIAPVQVTPESVLVEPDAGAVFLEELECRGVKRSTELKALAERIGELLFPADQEARRFLSQRMLVIQDDLFGFFCRSSLEVRSRVPINERTGTAAPSGPWQEEHMPAETLLHGLVVGRATAYVQPERQAVPVTPGTALGTLGELLGPQGRLLRIGGKSSVGIGRARMLMVNP